MGIAENKKVVQDFVMACGRKDTDAALELMNADGTFELIPGTPWSGVYGKEGFRGFCDWVFSNIQEEMLPTVTMIGEGDDVFFFSVAEGKYSLDSDEVTHAWSGWLFRFAPNGKIQAIFALENTKQFIELCSKFPTFTPQLLMPA